LYKIGPWNTVRGRIGREKERKKKKLRLKEKREKSLS
jgi:hypothetical protein